MIFRNQRSAQRRSSGPSCKVKGVTRTTNTPHTRDGIHLFSCESGAVPSLIRASRSNSGPDPAVATQHYIGTWDLFWVRWGALPTFRPFGTMRGGVGRVHMASSSLLSLGSAFTERGRGLLHKVPPASQLAEFTGQLHS